MKRFLLVAAACLMLGSSSGCYLIDHIFHCGGCGWHEPCGHGCDSCGGYGCDSCGGYAEYGHGGCDSCGHGGHFGGGYGETAAQCGPRGCGRDAIGGGPATGTVAYPYYTTRGPRDFLASNPRDIGP